MTKHAKLDDAPLDDASIAKAKAKAKEAVDMAADRVEQGVDYANSVASDLTEQASAELRRASETGTKFVRENPYTAMAGALGIGILVGLALRGRD